MTYPIVRYGNPVLEQPAETVTEFDTPELKKLLEDMFESMYAAKGVGLAAPQIGIGRRIAVIDPTNGQDEAQKLVLINPEIVETRGKQFEEEGCLSLPEIREKVQRAAWVKVKAQNERGEWFEVEGEELLARAILHEIDHLNGVLFIDRISRLKRELALHKIRKMQKNGEW
ncbi:MAG TPA: peptide deformylase [Bryobacteraceae bacterium]|nr:peptide deformylase [Bryobacteraceae bacterium]